MMNECEGYVRLRSHCQSVANAIRQERAKKKIKQDLENAILENDLGGR